MNKIQFSPLFVNFCSKNNLDINMVYLCQCALMAENPQECLSVLLESLRSDDFDQLLRLVLCNWEDEFIIRSEVPLFFMIPDEVVEKKEKGKGWKDLTKSLGQISIDITSKYGYFFSPKGSLQDAKHEWETGKYDFDKSLKYDLLIEVYDGRRE